MELWVWLIIGGLVSSVIGLVIKLKLMRKSAREIRCAFQERLDTDTNTLIDISIRDRAMRSLAQGINAQLRRLRRERQRYQQGDAELKEAVTNIAHDLRTPLTAISGYLQLLQQEEKSVRAARYLSLIENRIDALRSLTEELFGYSILIWERELKCERVVINAVLEESLAAAYSAFKQRGIQPQISITEHRVERQMDQAALSRIFENIIANAIKYSDGDFSVSMGKDGIITFANAASGLDVIAAGRLFDRFYTVETGRGSTGLGLSIAKLFSERMGGRIGAKYDDGRLVISLSFDHLC